jgi:hypothetical protein
MLIGDADVVEIPIVLIRVVLVVSFHDVDAGDAIGQHVVIAAAGLHVETSIGHIRWRSLWSLSCQAPSV